MKTLKSFFQFFTVNPGCILKRHFYVIIRKLRFSDNNPSIREDFSLKMKLKSPMLVVICLLLCTVLVHAQTPFEKYFPGTGESVSVQPIPSGGYIGAVNFYFGGKFWLFRMNEQGDTLWTKTFQSGGDVIDRWAIRVAVVADGGFFILCGNSMLAYSCQFNSVMKTDAQGDSIWSVIISSTELWSGAGFEDLIATPVDGGCVAVGHGSAGGDPRILKISSAGAISWETVIEAFIYTYFSSVCLTSDSGYIATGLNHNNSTGINNLLVAKFNSNGDSLWYKTFYSGLFDSGDSIKAEGFSAAPTLDGGCMLAGYVTEPGIYGSYALLMRLNASGDVLWTKRYFHPENIFQKNVAYKLVRLPFNEYLMYLKRNGGSSAIGTLLKLNLSGDSLWSQVGYDYRIMMNTVDEEGGILFTGYVTEDVAVFIRTTMGGLYVSPQPSLPINNSINVSLNPNLVWGSPHFVNSSSVQVATDIAFTDIVFASTNVTANTLQVTQLSPITKYFWRVQSFGKEGGPTQWSEVWNFTTQVSVSVEDNSDMPVSFSLEQNYPNPFNPATKIKYTIPSNVKREMSKVELKIYDVLGSEIATLVNEEKPAGFYEVKFDASNLVSGFYFYRLQTGSFVETKKMMLVK